MGYGVWRRRPLGPPASLTFLLRRRAGGLRGGVGRCHPEGGAAVGVPGVGAGPRLAVEETELVVDGAVAERRLLCVGR